MTYALDQNVQALAAAMGAEQGSQNARLGAVEGQTLAIETDPRWTLTPLQFGAVGDGATDDTAAVQAMFDAIGQGGGEVVIPNRRFVIRSTLRLPKLVSGKRVMIRGTGHQSEFYCDFAAPGHAIYAGDATATGGGLGWTMRDFRIRGKDTATVTGIYLENANSAEIRCVSFHTLGSGLTTRT